jgi:hypothetical protein
MCVTPDEILVWRARLGEIFCDDAPKYRLGAFRGASGDALSHLFSNQLLALLLSDIFTNCIDKLKLGNLMLEYWAISAWPIIDF